MLRLVSASVVRVWDLPTRLFHWSLLFCVAGAFLSAQLGAIDWHFRFGFAVLTLVIFRTFWGFMGPKYARFSSFPPNILSAMHYLRFGSPVPSVGHSPLGAISVYALLFLVFLQSSTGLFSNDSIVWYGPLASLISDSWSNWFTWLHKLNRWALIVFIGLHVSGIIWYRLFKKESLVLPMIVGDKKLPLGMSAESAQDTWKQRVLAAVFFAISVGFVWGIWSVQDFMGT